ncbi:MAG: cold-shock protein [Alphaproteobacteria bacterium]|nr:cold-shock protein [Alphaproteobacteria bacterium]
MSYPFSQPEAGARTSATVKWYDAAKGYGFLVPDDGTPDIFCRAPILAAAGLVALLTDARVECETVLVERGREVSRILAVDFSAALPPVPPPARSFGDRLPAGGPAGPGRELRALVKWFDPAKGYGFLEPEDGSADLFCHLSTVQASGRETLPQGATVTCGTGQGDRGPQVSRILSVEPPAAGSGPVERSRPSRAGYSNVQGGPPPSADMELPGTVKFFDPARGFGFVVPDAGGREVFVHSSVLFRSGMTDLEPGQRVFVRAENVPRGLQATTIEAL